jgi:hypothetical protein
VSGLSGADLCFNMHAIKRTWYFVYSWLCVQNDKGENQFLYFGLWSLFSCRETHDYKKIATADANFLKMVFLASWFG